MPAKSATKLTAFEYYAPHAKEVVVSGSFNKWNTKKALAKKDSKGSWKVKVALKPGRYEYKFIVDGNWVNDPRCTNCVANTLGTHNCVIDVK
ncbi:MAG: glycogen-binding domain-containing protein [Candidatus Omnitrophota bacterium]